MSARPFHFKRFTVSQERATHKVGTDGVLLGAWVSILQENRSFLDIGTGTGLIALMLAQRTHAEALIDAVEISEKDAHQAAENVAHSPWPAKIVVHQTPVQAFFPRKTYDLIVTNPPFFINSLQPPDRSRSTARHANELSFDVLLTSDSRLLAPQGRFSLILPPAEGRLFTTLARNRGLQPVRMCPFRTRRNKPIERLLIEFARDKEQPPEADIVLYGENGQWTEPYRKLTGDFYLKC